MNLRKQKGLEISKTKTIQSGVDGWIVPSQSGNKNYFVRKNYSCSCPDHKNRDCTCKHAFAVQYYLQKITIKKGKVKVEAKKLTYPQAWSAYNKSQETEKERFMELLKDLLENIEEPDYNFGRPKISEKDLMFASALKVYSQFSLRRFMSDLKFAKEKELIQKVPCFASVGHFMQKKQITKTLKQLISKSGIVLKTCEEKFCIDSTGFRTTKFNEYCKEKHDTKRRHEWLKLHAVCGAKTNIITSCEVSKSHGTGSGDSPNLIPLAIETKENGFDIQEFSADMAYSSRDNLALIDDFGGTAYIPFKKSARGIPKGKNHIWRKMFHYFKFNQDEFMQHYHKRSNIETTFFMIKSKFNDCLKSKTHTAQKNELLLKVLCHNIVVVIHETNELGIAVNFKG